MASSWVAAEDALLSLGFFHEGVSLRMVHTEEGFASWERASIQCVRLPPGGCFEDRASTSDPSVNHFNSSNMVSSRFLLLLSVSRG